mgnify:CR=1 FL=1
MSPVRAIDILIAALTIYGEARGCSQHGRLAVAHTIINRAKEREYWGMARSTGHPDHSLAAVCLRAWQYSVWNESDPNRLKLEALREEYERAIEDIHCRNSLKALIDALDGHEPDPTDGATHYLTQQAHEKALRSDRDHWSKGRDYHLQIGSHRFFKGVA